MSVTKIEKALRTFLGKHRDETFYAMAVDAGYLYLNSEEEFEKRRQRHSAEWEDETKAVTLAEVRACDQGELASKYPSLAFSIDQGDSFKRALEVEQTARAKQRAKGNPYEKRGSPDWKSLRYGTGNFTYGEIVSLNLDEAYQAHYENDQPANSPYAKKVRAIIAALKRDEAKLLARVKRSKDFRIYSVDHRL
jgi:hypothetical protein